MYITEDRLSQRTKYSSNPRLNKVEQGVTISHFQTTIDENEETINYFSFENINATTLLGFEKKAEKKSGNEEENDFVIPLGYGINSKIISHNFYSTTQLENLRNEIKRMPLVNDSDKLMENLVIIFDHIPQENTAGTWYCKNFQPNASSLSYVCRIIIDTDTQKNRGENEIKTTLAHEMGHHLTIGHTLRGIYQLTNEIVDLADFENLRLPELYYTLRGLDEKCIFPNYRPFWHRCDKEIIAEDYRACFNLTYNQPHQCVYKALLETKSPQIMPPDLTIKTFLECLPNLYRPKASPTSILHKQKRSATGNL